MREIKLELSPLGARRFFIALVVVLILSTSAIIVLGEFALRRWAPWASNAGMSILVAWVWMYHLMQIIGRKRTLLGGLTKALLFAAGTSGLIVGVLYLAGG